MFFYHLGECLIKQSAVYGYHHTTGGKDITPTNLLNLPAKDRRKVLKWYEENYPTGSKVYLAERKLMEKLLLQEAKKKLKNVGVKHPLYFLISKNSKESPGYTDGRVFSIDKSLMPYSTFTGGDSFDFYTKLRENLDKYKNISDVVSGNVLSYEEMLKNRATLEKNLMARFGRNYNRNYIEGQLWAPYKVVKNKLVLDDSIPQDSL